MESQSSAVKHYETRFRDLANALPYMVWMSDAVGQGTFANQVILDVLGVETLTNWPQCIHPEDRDESLRRYQQALTTGETYRVEHRLFDRRQGRYVWYLAQATPARDASGQIVTWYGTATDIDDLKNTEQELRRERDRLQAIAVASPGVIFTVHEHGDQRSLVYAAPTFEKLFGVSAEQFFPVGDQALHYVHEDDRGLLYKKSRDILASGQGGTVQFRIHHPKSGLIWIECHTAPRVCEDGSILWHGVFTDVTQRKLLEAQVMQATKLEAIGTLASGVAHDFNNLLTAIISASELATMAHQNVDVIRSALHTIQVASQRAAGLTKQLLTFSRRQEIKLQELELNQVICDSESILRRLVGNAVQLKLTLTPNLPSIRADATQLVQVLINLVLNARDALSTQDGLIEIRTATVRDSVPTESPESVRSGETGPTQVALQVIDNGVGIPEAIQGRVFDPFFTTKPLGKGTGLGLAVVHGIVNQCGGSLSLRSTPGQGTHFEIKFPVLAQKQNENGPTAASHLQTHIPHLVPEPTFLSKLPARSVSVEFQGNSSDLEPHDQKRILIVDDELAVAETSAQLIEPLGYEVMIADSALRALEYLQLPEVRPIDLLITDLMMPECRGDRFALEVRRLLPDLPIVIWSGQATDRIQIHDDLLIEAFVEKPFTPGELIRLVKKIMAGQEKITGSHGKILGNKSKAAPAS